MLSDEAVFAYKCDNPYTPSADRGVLFSDPAIGIDWRIDVSKALLSEKDKKHPLLAQIEPWEDVR